jgi:hypothetical protein
LDNENYFNCIVTNILQEQKKEETDKKSVSSVSVPGAGIEPAQHCYHWCLRPARLPIPPSGPEKTGLRKYKNF